MCKVLEDMRAESLKEGIEIGIEKGSKATALRMLKAKKYTLDEVAAMADLSLDEVKELSSKKTI